MHYKAHAVEPEQYRAFPLESEFCGGTVVDGMYDPEHECHILVTHHESQEVDWKQMYHILRSLIDRVYVANAVDKMTLARDIAGKDTVMAGTKAACVRDLLTELARAGAIQIGKKDYPTEIHLTADALVIRDRETFNTLPLIVDEQGDIDFTPAVAND